MKNMNFQTPCFVHYKQDLANAFRQVKRGLGNVVVAYSVKTNPNPDILRLLKKQGSSFMLCSVNEVLVAKKLLGDVKNSVFLQPSMTEKELSRVWSAGVRLFVVDCPSQLRLFDEFGRKRKVKVRVLLRLNTKVETRTVYRKAQTLGMDQSVLLWSARHPAGGVEVIGLHNHLVTNNEDSKAWGENLKKVRRCAEKLAEQGVRVQIIDIGGGFPLPGRETKKVFEIVQKNLHSLRKVFKGVVLIAEIGRFVAGCGRFLCKVQDVKELHGKRIVFVNASLYNSLMDVLIAEECLTPVAICSSNRRKIRQIIRGNTPDSLDVFVKDALLPELRAGDFVEFEGVGAYNFKSDFINLKPPREYVVSK